MRAFADFPTTSQGEETQVRSEESNPPHLGLQGEEQVGKYHRKHTPHPTLYGVWGVVRKGSAETASGEQVGNGWGSETRQGCRRRLRELLSELNEPQPQRTT